MFQTVDFRASGACGLLQQTALIGTIGRILMGLLTYWHLGQSYVEICDRGRQEVLEGTWARIGVFPDVKSQPVRTSYLLGHAFCLLISSISGGTISKRSPTIPYVAISKMGASLSLLMATTVLEPFIPTMCWMAPEIPKAT